MSKEETKSNNSKKKVVTKNGGAGGLWFVGFIGALAYFLHYHSGSLWLVLVAIFKAIFWIGFLVYYLLRFMHI